MKVYAIQDSDPLFRMPHIHFLLAALVAAARALPMGATAQKITKKSEPFYDSAKDFTHVSLLATAPLVLVTPTHLPFGGAFFDAARSGREKWNYGAVVNSYVGHSGLVLVKSKAAHLRLNAAVFKIIWDADTRQKLLNQGWQAVVTSPEGLVGRMKSKISVVSGMICMHNIKIERPFAH